jgi:hypothetical protein
LTPSWPWGLPAGPIKQGQSSFRAGGRWKQSSTLRFQEQRLQPVPEDHPIAPTEFPKGWSAIHLSQGTRAPYPEYSIHPSGGGYLPPVTPEAVTSLGLPPNVLGIMLAIGQWSTDSSKAWWAQSPTGYFWYLQQRRSDESPLHHR